MFFDTTFSKAVLLSPGNVERNPSCWKYSFIKFRHWNLNDLAAHHFIKVPLIEAFISTYSNNPCLSETFLDWMIDFNDGNINNNDYSILKASHPSNSKHRGVWIYFKQSLPLTRRDDISTMQETIKIQIWVKNMFFYTLP